MTNEEKQRAKEKAEELVTKFYCDIYFEFGHPKINYEAKCIKAAKQCASIAVDEILHNDGFTECDIYLTEFWLQVRKEIKVMNDTKMFED